jgi:ABC-type dipeptide/oligopeptide/nickel transport system permease subunit
MTTPALFIFLTALAFHLLGESRSVTDLQKE